MHDNFLMVSNRKTKSFYIQLGVSGHLDFFFFFLEREREREFQSMTSTPDDSFLSSDQDTNQFLV